MNLRTILALAEKVPLIPLWFGEKGKILWKCRYIWLRKQVTVHDPVKNILNYYYLVTESASGPKVPDGICSQIMQSTAIDS